MQNKKRRGTARRAKARDAFSNPLARLGFDTPNLLEGTQYSFQRLTRDYATLNALYRESWIVRRIIDTIPGDMLKNGFHLTTELGPDLLKRFEMEMRRTQFKQQLNKGLKWGRLYGGALGVMLIKGQGDDLSTPLDLDLLLPGDYAGILILDRWNGVSPNSELVSDIDDPEYGLPDSYLVTDPSGGRMVNIHHSRCIRFPGNDLPYWEQLAEIYWGASVLESVFDELKKRDNVSWNIAQLTFMANLRVLKMADLGQLLASTDSVSQRDLYNTLQAQNALMNNMGMMIMDAADGMETHQYTFGGLAQCYEQFIMDIAGAAEIPVTKLFGRSPSGMDATGESDLQNYYDMIGEKQESVLRPILNKILPVLCLSVFGAIPDDLDFDFDPVAEPSDEQRTELAKTGTDIVVSAVQAGLVSPRAGLKELKQQSERTNVWTNITDEDIAKASDEIDNGEMDGMGGYPGMGGMPDEELPQDTPQEPTAGPQPLQMEPQDNLPARQPLNAYSQNVAARDWWNPNQPREANGRFAEMDGAGGGGGEPEKEEQNDLINTPSHVKISPTGKNKMYKRGFINEEAALHHWGGGGTHDHSKEYEKDGITTFEQYVNRACELLESECVKGGIRGFKTLDGYICRYDPRTNDYAVGHPLNGIKTMFKPKLGAAYYEQKRKTGG